MILKMISLTTFEKLLSNEQITIIARRVRQEMENEERIEKEYQDRLEKEREDQRRRHQIEYWEKEREANTPIVKRVANFCFTFCCTEYVPAFSIPFVFVIFFSFVTFYFGKPL